MLTSQGILISPNMPVVTTPGSSLPGNELNDASSHEVDTASSLINVTTSQQTTPSPPIRKVETTKWKGPINKPAAVPLNLISAANQQKVAQSVQVKQQLPLKLSKLSSGGLNSGGVGGNSASGGIQQMLPLKLSQGSADSRRSMGSLSNSGTGSGTSGQ
ncbi:hypothetical protein FOCC_FOCC012288 [Frankliniella occidentalis]|nr:hypothetical protein FOCC_FOCC012288 [Frankliniella occidentalis]